MNLGVRAVATPRTDDESFEALFRAEYARVAGIANRVLMDQHEAEDVAQEVFVRLYRHGLKFPNDVALGDGSTLSQRTYA